VAVGGSRERGVVAAASYEARTFGVRSAMPSVTAKRRCPDLIFVKPRFDVYRAVSLQIREIFAEYTPIIEPLSLDEAYLDVTENLKGIASATEIAEDIRARETNLTASAGVSYNKFLAKLASDHRKPDGLFVITPKMGPAFVENLPVAKFHGVGPALPPDLGDDGLQRQATGARGRTVTLKVKFADFQQITRSKSIGDAIDSLADLECLSLVLLEPLLPTGKGVRVLGISLSSLAQATGRRRKRTRSAPTPWIKCSGIMLHRRAPVRRGCFRQNPLPRPLR
jgi:nucleotidyltransferase/DNA polymerase involved in DNA repair